MMKKKEYEPLYKVNEAANILGFSVSGVYLMIERGDIRVLTIGKSYRIKSAEIERLLNESDYMSDSMKRKLIALEKMKTNKRN